MKKILFIGMGNNQGGIETFMLDTFMHLEGHNFHFEFTNITNDSSIVYSDFISNHGGVIRRIPIDNNKWITHLYRYRIAYNFFKQHHDYDIVHVNAMSVNSIFWLKAAQKFGIEKLILHSHSDNIKYNSILRYYFGSLLAMKNRNYINNHSNIIELSASNSAGRWMFHNDNFQVVNNGIDTSEFLFNMKEKYKIKNNLNIDSNDKVLITVARIDYQKNYFKIISIFNEINNILPNTKLLIIGEGPYKEMIYSFVKKLKLQDKIMFLGMISNVNEVLNVADLMLMPSRYEAFPFSLIEAQAEGVPALVSTEAVPKSSNITGALKYVSLKEKDKKWANIAIKLLNKFNNTNLKIEMNRKITNSKYNINSAIKQIKNIYLR